MNKTTTEKSNDISSGSAFARAVGIVAVFIIPISLILFLVSHSTNEKDENEKMKLTTAEQVKVYDGLIQVPASWVLENKEVSHEVDRENGSESRVTRTFSADGLSFDAAKAMFTNLTEVKKAKDDAACFEEVDKSELDCQVDFWTKDKKGEKNYDGPHGSLSFEYDNDSENGVEVSISSTATRNWSYLSLESLILK